MAETQNDKILRYLTEQGGITPLEALDKFGVMRLASLISELKQMGHSIKTELVKAKNRSGDTVVFAKYILEDKNDAE